MKKMRIIITLVGFGLLLSCAPQQSHDNPELLKATLREFFDAMKAKDEGRLNAVTTPDFVLFEDGVIWNVDSLMKALDRPGSFEAEWTLDNMKVNVDNNSGDIVYFNHGDFAINDTINFKPEWLESATFRKIDGKWKLNFLHSTVRH